MNTIKRKTAYCISLIIILCSLSNCDFNSRIVTYDNKTDYDINLIPYDNDTWTKFTLHAHEIKEINYYSDDCPRDCFAYSKEGLVYCYIEKDDYYVFEYHILPK